MTGLFHDTEEQALLRDALDGAFRREADAGGRGWSPERWQSLADDLDILAAPLPEALGGLGGSLVDAAIVMESLGEHLLARPYLESVAMAGRAIASIGGARAGEVVAGIRSGAMRIAVGWRDPGVRDHPARAPLVAEPDGAGFRLRGARIMVRWATEATHLLVSARSGASVALFLVETGAPGVTMHPAATIDGHPCADIVFDDVRVTDRVVGPDRGALALDRMLVEGGAMLCAEGVGLMRAMLAQTIDHARQRHQFGKPLAAFQVLQHRLVDMRIALEHARSMARAAAGTADNGTREAALLVSAAQHVVGRALNRVAREAVQIHGAIGMMAETPLARYFRRATVIQHQLGSAAHHLACFAEAAGSSIPEGDAAAALDDLLHPPDPDEIAFRNRIRASIQQALTPELREEAAWETGAFATPSAADPWQAALAGQGWAAPAWPVEHGGPGWSPAQRRIFEEEQVRAGAPRLPAMGLQMCAPVLMRFGTEEQKARFLPGILSGEVHWCQGYSEPGAGSDLAALQLRATRDADDYVLNGTKIWTTFAQFADWIFVLARTAQTGKRQDGISFLLVPMDTAGLSVRPLLSISGDHEVNQLFFDDVRVPVANRVGEENDGWRVAKYLLEFERGVGHQVPALVMELARLRDIARAEPGEDGALLWDSPDFRRRYAEIEIAALALRLTEERLVYQLPAGQSAGDFAASLMKLGWSELAQEIDELMIEALGPYAMIDQQPAFATRDAALVTGPGYARTPMRRYLNDRVMTIAGGSSEIQRTILARLILG